MCGIAGWLGTFAEGAACAKRMVQALQHRGPDAHGIRTLRDATLVHTRLSIIDLSPAGAQPMANEDGTIWVVFNGEIYNHKELRHSLETKGHVLKGHSDTEVLPHLYEEEGPAFVSKLRGMFALAVYDCRSRTIVLARDRFGIKPLFYALAKERLAFASEIRALLECPGIDLRPDRQAVYDFSALFYIPAPQTFYKGIRAVEPGQMVVARFDGNDVSYKTQGYHRWTIAPDPGMSRAGAANQAQELIDNAVRRQLESDVPLGSLLSGGIDSSLVSTAAQTAVGRRLKTFNAKFSDQEYDETWAAVAVAEHIGSDHSVLDINNMPGTWSQITELLLHAGQPFADTSLFAVNALCRLIRRHVTVALSGDGGDEAFGGYDTYWQIARLARIQALPPVVQSAAGIVLASLATLGVTPRHVAARMKEFKTDDISIVQDLHCWIREKELSSLCIDHEKLLPIRRLFEPQWEYHIDSGSSRLERLSAHITEVGVRLSLSNDFLFKVDTASMKESLEVRVPMLDEDLVAFGLSLPHKLKVKGRMCKRVLRAVAARRLPRKVAQKPKWGFGIPVDTWVDTEFKIRLREELLSRSSRLSEFFRPEAYQRVVHAFCDRGGCPDFSRQGLYQRAIMFLSVHLALTH